MILYLLLCILFATGLLIILKCFVKWKADTLHAIVFNYWTAVSWSIIMDPGTTSWTDPSLKSVLPFAMITGLMFITVFFITGKTTQAAGVGTASVASKMSMIIPITAGFILYNESTGIFKTIGILLAIPSVILISSSGSSQPSEIKKGFGNWLPALLFLGAGMVDTMIKFAQHHYINDSNRNLVIMIIFASAGTFGLITLGYEILVMKKKVSLTSLWAGILLGSTNYFSLFFLLKCLEHPGSESSTIFASVNIGVVILSFFTGLILFRENAGQKRLIGLFMAILAIVCLSY